DRFPRPIAEQRLVEPLCGGEPDQEYDHQDHSESGDAVEGTASQHSEGVLPRNIDTLFALPAQFVEADGREGADQGEARRGREEEWHHVVAECHAGQKQADNGIDDGDENDLGRHHPEVVDAFRCRVLQICKPDLADDWISRALARTGEDMEIWHSKPPAAVLRTVARLEVTQCFYCSR